MIRHDPHPQGCDHRYNPPATKELRDDEMVCANCEKYPDMPKTYSKDDQWDALFEGGECVACLKAEIASLRSRLADKHKLYERACRERDFARAEWADREA